MRMSILNSNRSGVVAVMAYRVRGTLCPLHVLPYNGGRSASPQHRIAMSEGEAVPASRPHRGERRASLGRVEL
jgi:hypothetical protein